MRLWHGLPRELCAPALQAPIYPDGALGRGRTLPTQIIPPAYNTIQNTEPCPTALPSPHLPTQISPSPALASWLQSCWSPGGTAGTGGVGWAGWVLVLSVGGERSGGRHLQREGQHSAVSAELLGPQSAQLPVQQAEEEAGLTDRRTASSRRALGGVKKLFQGDSAPSPVCCACSEGREKHQRKELTHPNTKGQLKPFGSFRAGNWKPKGEVQRKP